MDGDIESTLLSFLSKWSRLIYSHFTDEKQRLEVLSLLSLNSGTELSAKLAIVFNHETQRNLYSIFQSLS